MTEIFTNRDRLLRLIFSNQGLETTKRFVNGLLLISSPGLRFSHSSSASNLLQTNGNFNFLSDFIKKWEYH